jgi:hypothetical protein
MLAAFTGESQLSPRNQPNRRLPSLHGEKQMGTLHSRCNISVTLLTCLGLVILESALGLTRPAAAAPFSVDGIECARISELDVYKQVSPRATMIRIECGLEEGPSGWFEREGGQKEPGPATEGAGGPLNVNTITGETTANAQSETMVWSSPDGMTIVVVYNDFEPPAFSGISVSTDGGAIFTRLRPSPFAIRWWSTMKRWPRGSSAISPAVVRVELVCGAPPADSSGRRESAPLPAVGTASPCGWITIRPARITGECTFPGTVLVFA